jgi:hypothetical protein
MNGYGDFMGHMKAGQLEQKPPKKKLAMPPGGGLLVGAVASMVKGGFGKKQPNTDKRASVARATSNRFKRARGHKAGA